MESILKSELERQLLARCAEVMEPLGFRTVDLDCHVGGRSVVRIYIERIPSEISQAGVVSPGSVIPSETRSASATLEDCATVSRLIGPILEAEPNIPGAFDLEVSSPGLDRRLRLRPDFDSSLGMQVKLKLVEKLEGRGANITGRLTRVEPAHVMVEVDKDEVSIPWQKIKQAVRVWSFGNQQ